MLEVVYFICPDKQAYFNMLYTYYFKYRKKEQDDIIIIINII